MAKKTSRKIDVVEETGRTLVVEFQGDKFVCKGRVRGGKTTVKCKLVK